MAGAEPSGQLRDEKLHAVVARSTFRSQNAKNTSLSEHFWKFRCRKGARRCGPKLRARSHSSPFVLTCLGPPGVKSLVAVVLKMLPLHSLLGLPSTSRFDIFIL